MVCMAHVYYEIHFTLTASFFQACIKAKKDGYMNRLSVFPCRFDMDTCVLGIEKR